MGKITPTMRTLEALRKLYPLVEVVERWNPFGGAFLGKCDACGHTKKAGLKHDLFGFADILCVDIKNKDFLLVQCTSYSEHSKRRKKISANLNARDWCAAGGRIQIWSWRKKPKKKKDGSQSKFFEHTSRIEDIHIPF